MKKNEVESRGESHDRVLGSCFQWLWNSRPDLRYLMFHPKNESRPYPGESISHFRKRLSQDLAIGVVPGVLDLVFYYGGTLYILDCKIGTDRLSEDQKAFIKAVEAQGGKHYVFSSLEEFQIIINEKILLLDNGSSSRQ